MKKTLTILTILVIAIIAMVGSVNAASTSVNPTQVEKGKTVSVTVQVNTAVKGAEFQVKYDSNLFEYAGVAQSGAKATAKNGVVYYTYLGDENKTMTINFTAKQTAGEGKFEVVETEFTGADRKVTGEEVTPAVVSVKVTEPAAVQTPSTETENQGNTGNSGTTTDKVGTDGNTITKLPQTGAPTYLAAVAVIVIASAVLVIRKISK